MRRRITLRYGIALSICLGMASSPLCAAGVGARPGLDLVLMVDLEKFAADDLAPFRQSLLAQAAKSDATNLVTLLPGETLNQLVARVYGYGDQAGGSAFRGIQADLVGSIIDINNVEPAKLREGQTLKVPQFVRRPMTEGSWVSKAQVLNASKAATANVLDGSIAGMTWSYTVAPTSQLQDAVLWTRELAISDKSAIWNTTQRDAGTTLLRVDADRLDGLGGLPGLRAKVHDGTFSLLPNPDIYIVNFGQAAAASEQPGASVAADEEQAGAYHLTPAQVQKVRQWGPAKLYLLDVFSDTGGCRHGDLVYDKAVQTLNSLGLGSEAGRIQKQSIDFYADRSKNTQYIKDWIQRSFRGSALRNYNLQFDLLTQSPAPIGLAPDTIEIPGLFLQALYGTLAADSATLGVSGSFFTVTPDGAFPKDIILHGRANLINAVLNDTSAIESPTQYAQEPLSSFNLYRDLLGTVLVGYFDAAGTPRGMYSTTGTGVTTIDEGVVVGTQGACKGVTGSGASYATPVVAIKLLVGRMLWTPKSEVSDAMAARNRLLSSALVRKAYLGKYWSGGAASPARLYASRDGPYALLPDGRIVDAAKMSGHLTVTAEIPLASGSKLVDYVFDTDPDDPSPAFTSLFINDDSVFMLERQAALAPVWRERKVKSICLCTDDRKALSLSEAAALIKEVHKNE
ncbi:hypothetical protein [Achromobacter piechaudii]|uniref:Peptidase S8/S53 domain-containing protein n=1 Tax=Achromobacter piechaudii TaxID=72556 RepID=A0ABM8L1C0_9BURK|nr:hypothetical protein [Achromobacter piechaudii]CAB3722709.1 hypothetical protein LMG1873_04065 [Achromobacter piechaudii]CAB3894231.1 hypothetical protein LMG2828_04149 [Achromobacter piechaudii]CAB3957421.1 hypothetical protein LMG6103_05212 [Achromobacter piechaudii]